MNLLTIKQFGPSKKVALQVHTFVPLMFSQTFLTVLSSVGWFLLLCDFCFYIVFKSDLSLLPATVVDVELRLLASVAASQPVL